MTLPIARRGIGAGIALSFAHTIGEFGVVLMLGGSIPGVTRVASIALYDEVQKLNYAAAHSIALLLLGISFLLILAIVILQRRATAYHVAKFYPPLGILGGHTGSPERAKSRLD